ALLLPTYVWLTLAVFLPLLTMFVFSFMSATPMGKAPIVFTLKQYRAFIDQPYLVERTSATAARKPSTEQNSVVQKPISSD
ncbi:hypothetical protein AB9F41_36945, partial [Rhizobium leguminosarum]